MNTTTLTQQQFEKHVKFMWSNLESQQAKDDYGELTPLLHEMQINAIQKTIEELQVKWVKKSLVKCKIESCSTQTKSVDQLCSFCSGRRQQQHAKSINKCKIQKKLDKIKLLQQQIQELHSGSI